MALDLSPPDDLVAPTADGPPDDLVSPPDDLVAPAAANGPPDDLVSPPDDLTAPEASAPVRPRPAYPLGAAETFEFGLMAPPVRKSEIERFQDQLSGLESPLDDWSPATPRVKPPPPATFLGQMARPYSELWKGLRAGTYDVGAIGAGFGEVASNVLDWKGGEDAFRSLWERFSRETQGVQETMRAPQLADIEDMTSFVDWLAGSTGRGAPQLGGSVLAYMAGGLPGMALFSYGMGASQAAGSIKKEGMSLDDPVYLPLGLKISAGELSALTGVPLAAIEFMGGPERFMPALFGRLAEPLVRNTLVKIGAAGLKAAGVEGTEEILQQWVSDGVARAASGGPFDAQWFKETTIEGLKQAAAIAPSAALFGAGAQAMAPRAGPADATPPAGKELFTGEDVIGRDPEADLEAMARGRPMPPSPEILAPEAAKPPAETPVLPPAPQDVPAHPPQQAVQPQLAPEAPAATPTPQEAPQQAAQPPVEQPPADLVAPPESTVPMPPPIETRPIKQAEAVTSAGRRVPVEYALVEADALIPSNLADLRPNPAYPADLQPRDRTRISSELQITRILNPERFQPDMLGETPDAANGAPVVGEEGFVESGNMRAIALRRAYAENGAVARKYREWLTRQGYPAEGMRAPVLVRVNRGKLSMTERAAFAIEANKPAILQMSPQERAGADARLLSDDVLGLAMSGDLTLASNRPFLSAILKNITTPDELAGLLTSDGQVSTEGLARARNALLARAYGAPDIVGTLTENPDSNIRMIGTALTEAAPFWARMRAAAERGNIPAEYDLTDNLMEAVRLIGRARSEEVSITDLLAQADAFSGQVSPTTESMLRWMLKGKSLKGRIGAPKMADALSYFAQEAMKATTGADLLGQRPEGRLPELMERARVKAQGAPEGEQLTLAPPMAQPRRAEGVGPRPGEGGEQVRGSGDQGRGQPAHGGREQGAAVQAEGVEPASTAPAAEPSAREAPATEIPGKLGELTRVVATDAGDVTVTFPDAMHAELYDIGRILLGREKADKTGLRAREKRLFQQFDPWMVDYWRNLKDLRITAERYVESIEGLADSGNRIAAGKIIRERAAGQPKFSRRPADEESFSVRRDQRESQVFFSALTRAIENAKQPKAPAAQWKGILAKMPGIKAEEIEWSGVNQWLDEQTGSVSREDLAAFLRENEVQVQEVMRGEVSRQDQIAVKYRVATAEGAVMNQALAEGFTEKGARDYTLNVASGDASEDRRFPISAKMRPLVDELRASYEARNAVMNASARFDSHVLPGGENYRELLLVWPQKTLLAPDIQTVEGAKLFILEATGTLPELVGDDAVLDMAESLWRQRFPAEAGQFVGGHFDEPNVLAHVRFNERTDAAGRRVLFIEEIQSDWHQRGRRKGYGARPGMVPDAPFKQSWHELAFKRALRWATENGFDAVAWTLGQQQIERYDLSKQVEAISATRRDDGTFDVGAKPKGATGFEAIAGRVKAAQLADHVGKDLAEKIVNQVERDGVYSGVDLRVGGEGMKAFYDRILVNFANKYGKTWGARVGEAEIDVPSVPYGPFRDTDPVGLTRVHALPITQSMRDSVMQGQPLFAAMRDRPTARFSAEADAIARDLNARLDQLGLAEAVKLRVVKMIRSSAGRAMPENQGRYFRRMIEVALDAESARWTLDHEAVHTLRDMSLIRPSEWNTLRRAAEADAERMADIRRRYAQMGLTDDQLVEEAVADMFADWAEGRMQARGFVRTAFERVKAFLQALGNALIGRGFNSPDMIFERIERGEVGRRAMSPDEAAESDLTEDRFARRRMDEPKVNLDARAAGTEGGDDGEGGPPRPPQGPGDGAPPPGTPDSAGNRRATAQGWIARGQPLDRAMRMPFDWFGGINARGEWQPGGKMFQKAANALVTAKFSDDGRFRFLNPMLESARRGLIDRYGLDPEYVHLERGRTQHERELAQKGLDVLNRLKDAGVKAAEAEVLHKMLTGQEVSAGDMGRLAAPIRMAIDEMGAEAVSLGLVSPESYERNRGAYLHRVYQKHEVEQPALSRWFSRYMTSKRKKLIGDEMKARGIFYDVDLKRLMKDVPGYLEARRGKPVKGERFRVLDKLSGQDSFEGIDAGPAKIERRVFLPADQDVPARFRDFTDRGVWEVRQIKGDTLVLWRDYTPEERQRGGEITDARYTIGKTFMLLSHDLATGRFYKDISENADWSQGTPPSGRWVDAADFRRLWEDPTVEWVRVPDTAIPDTGGKKRWGALAGRWVRSEIWRDLNELDLMQNPNTWARLLRIWKTNKTARSPVTHANNILSNFMLMDMADIRLQDFVRGVRSYIREDADFQEARDHGAFGADIITQEIKRGVLEPVLREIQEQAAGVGKNPVRARFGVLQKVAEAIWSKAMAIDQGLVRAYQMEDELFRMGLYLRRRDQGDAAEDAALEARQQFIDYDIRAPWVNAARRSVLPFIAYTYRAAPMIARTVAVRPWKVAKFFLIAQAMNMIAYMMEPGDEDEERRVMREADQGYTWIQTPRMMRMPYRDANGNPVFLDIRRWIPGGDIFDFNQNHGMFELPAPLQWGGPLMLAFELALNKSAFTGEPIHNEMTDDFWDRMAARGDYIYKAWMPSAAWVPGSWYWDKIGLSLKGAVDSAGRPYSLPEAVASSFGIKLKPQDVEENASWRSREFDKQRRALAAEQRRYRRLLNRGILSESAFDDAMKSLDRKRDRLDEKESKVFPKK